MAREQPSLRGVVLLHHEIPTPHFDLMFETAPGSPLATWRSAGWPIDQPATVEQLPDHRRHYLDYEGPVANDRGRVARVHAMQRGECIERGAERFVFKTPEEEFQFVKHAGQWTLVHQKIRKRINRLR